MPGALASSKLSTVQVTPEELERVRQLRAEATAGKKKSQDTGFKDYLKKNPDDAALSSAELKERCILNFMVLQLRAKCCTKSLHAVHEATVTSSRIAEKHWWNAWQMDSNLGPEVGAHWRESGNIQKKPCPVTGSKADEHVIWGVPKIWEAMTESDFKALRLETQREGKDGDEEAVAELSGISKASITDSDKPAASKTHKQIQIEFADDIKSQPDVYLRKYLDPSSLSLAF